MLAGADGVEVLERRIRKRDGLTVVQLQLRGRPGVDLDRPLGQLARRVDVRTLTDDDVG